MPSKFVRFVVGALLTTSSAHAMAQSAGWVVSEVRGPVTIVSPQGRTTATRGTAIQPGEMILTGSDARAVLVHDKDFVTVAPNSRICIPAETHGSSITRFFQDVGNAIFNVEKRGTPHFSVDTPYLAAVVKGTVFSVTVGADRTALQVTEGVVEVSTSDGGARELIKPGSIAMITASDRYRLTISGDAARVVDSPARPSEPAPAETPPPAAPTALDTPASPTPQSESAEPWGVRISQTVESKPTDLAVATHGVLTGLSPVSATAAAGLVKVAVVAVPPQKDMGTRGPDGGPVDPVGAGNSANGGTAPSGGAASGNLSNSDAVTPDAGKPDTGKAGPDAGKPEPAKPDAGKPGPDDGKGDKPGKDDAGKPDAGKPGPDDGKGDKPGKDDAGKPDAGKPGPDDGKGDKPGKDDAGKPDAGKPGPDDGKGDKPDKDDAGKPDAGKPGPDDGKGDKPDKDDAGKPDAGKPDPDDGKGDKPGKDDAGKPDAGKPVPDDGARGGKPSNADGDIGGKAGKGDDDKGVKPGKPGKDGHD